MSLAIRIRRAALTTLLLGALVVVLWTTGLPCAFARIFHEPCPGCGSTRAVIALAHGDLHGMLHMNPFGPVMALLIGALALQAIVSQLTWGDFRDAGTGAVGWVVKRGIYVVVVLEIVVWIARFFGFLGGPVPV